MARGLAPAVTALLTPVAVAGAAYLAFGTEEAPPGFLPPPPIATPTAEAAPTPRPSAPQIALGGVDAFHMRLRKPPRAGLAFDLETGEVLWRRRPTRVMPVASLTKIMTALLVVDRARASEAVRITEAALAYQGSGIGMLPKGKRVQLETLLNGLMLVSGNDAAIALAHHIAGSERRFVALMNRRAHGWGLECTRFASSHGLEDGNRSCARDLAVLTRLAMAKPRIRRVARRRQAELRFPIKGGKLYLTGHNPLMRLGYPGAVGLKTGYTYAAGRCFVGVARRGGRRLAVVLLNSPDPGKQALKLLDAGFARG